jgi:hypothetical protein
MKMGEKDDMVIQMEHFLRGLFIGTGGTTTSAGNVGGTTVIDTARTEAADYWNDHYSIIILNGTNAGEIRQIIDCDGVSSLTVDRAFTGQVAGSVGYLIRRDFYSIQGANSADNQVDTSNTSYNIDGSIVERTESLIQALQVVAAAGTGFEEDGSGATIYNTLIAVEGATDGAGTTSTIVDSNRTEGADYWNGNLVVMLAGSAAGEVRTIVDDDGAGTLTVEPLLGAASGNTNAYIILNQKSADWIVGDNNANNAYDSSAVVVNSDGSILERLEHILVALGGTTGTTDGGGTTTTAIDSTRTEANDYWNGGLFTCIDGTNAGLTRPISDFDAGTDTLTFEPAFPNAVDSGVEYIILARYDVARLVGADNNDNAIATTNITVNNDGSVLERVEGILSQCRSKGYNGDVYYVDDAGNDSNDGLTIATAFLTIDYAVGQCTALNDDVIIVLPGGYNENANTGGVEVDVSYVHIIGVGEGQVNIQNSNGAATAVFTVSALAEIGNMGIIETTNTVHGFDFAIGSNDSHLHNVYFTGAMENGVLVSGASNVIIEDNYFRTITNDGIEMDSGTYCRIRNNVFTVIGDNAIHINDATSNYNNVYNNVINGGGTTTNGINANAGNHNIIANNFVYGCTNNIVDNATNTHIVDNHEETYYARVGDIPLSWEEEMSKWSKFFADGDGDGATGTQLASDKSLVDALGTDGTTVTDGAVSVLGAIGADNANNAMATTNVTANEDGSVFERLEDIKINLTALGYIGTYFFVDAAAADDTGDGLTPATAKKTIDAGVNLTTANAGDVVLVYSTDGTAFDENANTGGVLLDTAQTAIIGIGWPQISNSNGAATAVFTVTGGRNYLNGLYINETTNTVDGIFINAVDYNTVIDCIIWGDMDNGVLITDADWNRIYDNHIAEMGTATKCGIQITGTSRSNRIVNNWLDNT